MKRSIGRRAFVPSVLAVVCTTLLMGCGFAQQKGASRGNGMDGKVKVHVFDAKGELVGPVLDEKVSKTDAEWKALLTPEQFRILRSSGTERPFCGALLENKDKGVYTCAGCGLPLFTSDTKFSSGTGWPSFYAPIAKPNVAEKVDRSHGMVRTEINCARCDGHLGHVFEDGPRPTGLRYCLNSESLKFTKSSETAKLADPAAKNMRKTAVFAGGCFWCVEAVFEEIEGVDDAISGYAGGTKEDADYKKVCSGTTAHAEAVQIIYDPAKVSFVDLLRVHFMTHDPTTLNRQGADVGPQYRSAIFYQDEEEKALAKAFIEDLMAASNQKKVWSDPIVTTLEPLKPGGFYRAENYHQNYVCENPNQGYVRGVALPKVEKVRKLFKDKLKKKSPLER